jgi:hypothetical protein
VALGADITSAAIEHQRIAAGNLEDWGASLGLLPAEKELVIDPERGRFWFRTPPSENVWVPVYHYGFSGSIGAGTYDRRSSILTANVTPIPNGGTGDPGPVVWSIPPSPLAGVLQFDDSKTYLPDADLTDVDELTLQAANFRRPYLKRIAGAQAEWVFRALPKEPVPPGEPEPESNLRNLTLEGLWIGIELHSPARHHCEALKEEGILCKETHERVIRIAPPLVIKREEIDWAFERIRKVIEKPGR